ncbi:MAG: alpha-N-acetylglucosaminidase C-terminal domain-containing protein, partial [Methylococcales bacterium]|nr:alpha-N-acetylglucosaminidase C-terminal domain-containing protein [Methylococcales bacterium]
LITTWSNQPDALDDYSHRQWAGLMKDYYLPRWQAFFMVHLDVLVKSRPSSSVNTWYRDLRAEKDVAFSNEQKTYPTQPTGDTVAIATRILKRYAPIARRLWSTQKQHEGLPWLLGTKKELVWNVSEIFIREGTYLCSIQWKSGQNALEIQSLALYEGDKKIVEDKHEGWTGIENRDNTYVITLNKLRTNLDAYTLRAVVSGAGGTDSRGTLKIRRIK